MESEKFTVGGVEFEFDILTDEDGSPCVMTFDVAQMLDTKTGFFSKIHRALNDMPEAKPVTAPNGKETLCFRLDDVVPVLEKFFGQKNIGKRAKKIAAEFEWAVFAKVDKGTIIYRDADFAEEKSFEYGGEFFTVYTTKAFGANKYFFKPAEIAAILGAEYTEDSKLSTPVSSTLIENCGIVIPNVSQTKDTEKHFCRLDRLVDFLKAYVHSGLDKDSFYRGLGFSQRLEEKILPEYLSNVAPDEEAVTEENPHDESPDELQRIKNFVAEYALMFGLSRFEALKEIFLRKFNPPPEMADWILLSYDKEWLFDE